VVIYLGGGGGGGKGRRRGRDAWKNLQETFPHRSIFRCTVFYIKSPTECCCTDYLRIYQPCYENVEAINLLAPEFDI
jgi:hypothetical protein